MRQCELCYWSRNSCVSCQRLVVSFEKVPEALATAHEPHGLSHYTHPRGLNTAIKFLWRVWYKYSIPSFTEHIARQIMYWGLIRVESTNVCVVAGLILFYCLFSFFCKVLDIYEEQWKSESSGCGCWFFNINRLVSRVWRLICVSCVLWFFLCCYWLVGATAPWHQTFIECNRVGAWKNQWTPLSALFKNRYYSDILNIPEI